MTLTENSILVKYKFESLDDVKNLNLWGSEVEDITILAKCINVEVISLSVNNINSLKPFSFCFYLSELYLRKNKIDDLTEIIFLQNCKSLKILWLEENPICNNSKYYRNYVIYHLPQLNKLDNITIHPAEREKSVLFFQNENKNKSPFNVKRTKQIKSDIIEEIKCNHKKINPEINIITPPLNIIPKPNKPDKVKIEDDYMSKFKNLDELTDFFSTPMLNYQNKKILNTNNNIIKKESSKGYTFKDSLKLNHTSSQFKNFNISQTNNIYLINAVNNLLEEMNITQLTYLKTIIDKKLRRDPDSII